MQILVEKTSELGHKLTISIDEEAITDKMEAKFKSLARKVRTDGFRPGKVPLSVVKKMYQKQVRGEVIGSLIQSSYTDAIKSKNLHPIGQPHIHPTEQTQGIKYTAEFEVYPPISLDKISTITLNSQTATIAASDLDTMTDEIRKQRKNWQKVARVAAKGDKVIIDFLAKSEGKSITDSDEISKDYPIELGKDKTFAGLDEAIIGLQAGDHKIVNLAKVANGKDVEFDFTINEVQEGTLPTIDEEFAKGCGAKDGKLSTLRDLIKANMQQETDAFLANNLRNQVLEKLHQTIAITAPQMLIDQEINATTKSYQQKAAAQNQPADLPKDLPDLCKKKVALSLIMQEIVQQNNLTITDPEVRTSLTEMAKNQQNPEEMIAWYYNNQHALDSVKNTILEKKAIDWIVQHAQVNKTEIAYAELHKNHNHDHEHDHNCNHDH